ncbi:MAG: WYL domain-containing protein [Deltaproteobacteria bacterium]|nr:WYL domain-containing protein [Deltaproteobacteria bacterium]
MNALTGHPNGRTVNELATELGVSVSTIKRDLGQFGAAGIEVERMLIDGRAAARLADDRHRSLVSITRRERYTLLATRRMFDVFAGTPLAEDIRSLLEKLAPGTTTQQREEIASDRDCFAYVPEGGIKRYRGKEDVLDAIQTGILKRRVLSYAYKTARGGTKKGYLAPFSMVMFKHGLYVIGRTLHDPSSRMSTDEDIFAVERFTSVDVVRKTSFEVPSDFKLDDKLVSAFELPVGDLKLARRVVVEFTAERATYVRAREWHKHQTLHEQPDGSVRLSFTCINLAPVVSWVLEWGPHALALEPSELVDAVAREIAETNARYQQRERRKHRGAAAT